MQTFEILMQTFEKIVLIHFTFLKGWRGYMPTFLEESRMMSSGGKTML